MFSHGSFGKQSALFSVLCILQQPEHLLIWKRVINSVIFFFVFLILGSINVNHENPGFGSNAVHNTKYKWWSFVFVNVMEQLM